jgi:hypothetical protein
MGVSSTAQSFQVSEASAEKEVPVLSVTEVIHSDGGSNYRLEFTDPNNDGNVVISEV